MLIPLEEKSFILIRISKGKAEILDREPQVYFQVGAVLENHLFKNAFLAFLLATQVSISFMPTRIVSFLLSKVVCSSRDVNPSLPPWPELHTYPPPPSPYTLCPSNSPSSSPGRTPALGAFYRRFVLQFTCTESS